MNDETPEPTDNSTRPEDGEQDVPESDVPVSGDADDAYDPDRDGV